MLPKNNPNTKNKQKNDQKELNSARKEWQKKHCSVCDQITNKLKRDPETFVGENLDQFEDVTELSLAIELQNQLKQLLEQKKILWPEEAVVEELNKNYAIVHAGQTYVLREKEHPVFGGTDFSLESRQSFRMYFEDEIVLGADGKKRTKADILLKSPLRRKYKDIIFDPTLSIEESEKKQLYNLWKGFAKKAKKGDCSKYWEHLKNNICAGDQEAYFFVRKWLAYVFQYPEQVHTALVLCGSQGVGKNSFVEPLGALLGPHYVLLSSTSELVSHFNFHLKNAVIIHANEAIWGGHRKELGTLKAMITEKTCLIEGKGKDRIMVRNYKHVIISSNENWPVHLDPDDRRFFVLHVSEKHKEDTVYFKALQDQLDSGGYEALLYDLLHEDLEDFDARRLPSSLHAFDMKMISANSAQKFIFDVLYEGEHSIALVGHIPKNQLYQEYRAWCQENEEKALHKNLFGKELKKLIPSIKNYRGLSSNGRREWNYESSGLEKARADFCKAFKETKRIWQEQCPDSAKRVQTKRNTKNTEQ